MKNRIKCTKKCLEDIYEKLNRKKYVSPDPLQFLYDYKEIKDREIAGVIASSLAYGRVTQILKSVSLILKLMGPSPYIFLLENNKSALKKKFKGFRHRFASDGHLVALLTGINEIIKKYHSIGECFMSGIEKSHKNIFYAMNSFCEKLHEKGDPGHLVPMPKKGSACKRMNLFLRWMIRKDEVDPGGWDEILPSLLIIPLDVHMHRISITLGLTKRKQANMKTAMEITSSFAIFSPDDPVKYDFALTRLGIRDDMSPEDFGYCLTSNFKNGV